MKTGYVCCGFGRGHESNALIKQDQFKLPEDLPSKYKTSEDWLRHAVDALKPHFANAGYEIPEVRASVGWTSAGMHGRRIGECWSTRSSSDGENAIFINTSLVNSMHILDVLAHELVHAVDDCQHKHGREYAKIAKAVGLKGPPWRSACSDVPLLEVMHAIAMKLGHHPYGVIHPQSTTFREMNSGRVVCPECGFTCRTLAGWRSVGHPLCPTHKVPLLAEWE